MQRDRIVRRALRDRRASTVFPSDANFVLFVPPGDAADVWQGLLDRGVLVRDLTAVVPERTAGDRGHRARGRPVPARASEEVLASDAPRAATVDAHDEGDRRPRRARRSTARARASADTGIPFFDHMLQQLGKHAGCDLDVTVQGRPRRSTATTPWRTVGSRSARRCAEALGDKAGIRRFASIVVPLDEAAVEVVLDLAGRTFVIHEVPVPYETIDGFDTGLLEDFVRAFAQAAELTVHVHLRYGRSPHHVCEAEFKALANALGDACALTGRGGVPSTKGTL